jgi:hypothetical protein
VTWAHRSPTPFYPLPPPSQHRLPPLDCRLAMRHITGALTPLLPLPGARDGPAIPIFPSPRFRCRRTLPLTSRPRCALLSDSKRSTTSPYSPLPRLAIPEHRRPPAVIRLRRVATALPAPGGSRLCARPLPSLNFISWLTSSSLSLCCRSCPRLSTVANRKQPHRQAPPPPHRPAPSVSAHPILTARRPARTTMVLVVRKYHRFGHR